MPNCPQGSSRQLGRFFIIITRCWRIPIYKIGGFSNERPESPCLRNLMLPETPKRSAKCSLLWFLGFFHAVRNNDYECQELLSWIICNVAPTWRCKEALKLKKQLLSTTIREDAMLIGHCFPQCYDVIGRRFIRHYSADGCWWASP